MNQVTSKQLGRGMKVWSLASPSGDWRALAEEVSSGRVDAQQNTVVLSPDNRQIVTGGHWRSSVKQREATFRMPCGTKPHLTILEGLFFVSVAKPRPINPPPSIHSKSLNSWCPMDPVHRPEQSNELHLAFSFACQVAPSSIFGIPWEK